MKLDLRTIDIHELLPQQEPFIMVGKLVYFDEKLTITETFIDEQNMFVENGHLSPSGLIENIAQTCAVRIGYINKYILNNNIQIGYIGAIRNLEITKVPIIRSQITTRMEVLEEVFNMILAKADVLCDNQTLATTEMKIAVTKQG